MLTPEGILYCYCRNVQHRPTCAGDTPSTRRTARSAGTAVHRARIASCGFHNNENPRRRSGCTKSPRRVPDQGTCFRCKAGRGSVVSVQVAVQTGHPPSAPERRTNDTDRNVDNGKGLRRLPSADTGMTTAAQKQANSSRRLRLRTVRMHNGPVLSKEETAGLRPIHLKWLLQ
jgi:hypothetical protein